MRAHLLAPVLAVSGSLLACGGSGSAQITGSIGAFPLELNTVYGWIDATELKMEGDKAVFAPRDKTRLVIAMSGAVFDPSQDFRFAAATELLDAGREAQRKGSAMVQIRNYHAFAAGGQLALPPTGDGDAPRLDVTISPGLTQLADDATYPATAPRLGSKVTATFTVSEAGRGAGETVTGSLVVTVAAAEGEPADVATGAVTIELEAPLISERIAECNNANDLNDQDCEPGYRRIDGG